MKHDAVVVLFRHSAVMPHVQSPFVFAQLDFEHKVYVRPCQQFHCSILLDEVTIESGRRIPLDADRSCGVKALKVVVMFILAYNHPVESVSIQRGGKRYSIGPGYISALLRTIGISYYRTVVTALVDT